MLWGYLDRRGRRAGSSTPSHSLSFRGTCTVYNVVSFDLSTNVGPKTQQMQVRKYNLIALFVMY